MHAAPCWCMHKQRCTDSRTAENTHWRKVCAVLTDDSCKVHAYVNMDIVVRTKAVQKSFSTRGLG
jgi:hypothetical protein